MPEVTSVPLISSTLMIISPYDNQKNLFDWEMFNRVIIMACRYAQVGPRGCFLSVMTKGESSDCDYNQEVGLCVKGKGKRG